ncbi:hypothetical protein FH972_022816 [Carpinus fangiana]|uniref:Uncharacterized protein n=1 Tax=Carpinus fangiana TaxID=176857 RepID=A0A5N6KU03_9ROSI|nr:hypothetical protein FH972_022816 [Carpinus fangiana]
MSTTGGAFVAGGIAACGAVTVTHSFETVKIRLQLQGELQAKADAPRLYKGVFHGISVILKNEGPKGLFRGLGSAAQQYIYQMTLNGCRLGFYEPLRKTVTPLFYNDVNKQSIPVNIFCGASSGIIGAAAGSPFFLVKTRLQSFSPFLPVGTQHKYRNAWDGLSQIYRGEGVRGLYRGVGPAMIRTGFGSSVQLPTYFLAKRNLQKHLNMEDGPALHLASSAASGVAVCCVMHPPDTVMSRMYNQTGNLYKSAFDCLTSTIRAEGPMAVYKGFFAHLARILPHTILTLSLAEQTNKLMRRFEDRLSLHDVLSKFNEEHSLARPHAATSLGVSSVAVTIFTFANRMRRDTRIERTPVAHALDDASHVRRAVELVHLLGHADVRVDHRVIIRNHVLVGALLAALERVRRPAEEVLPERGGDELQQRQDVGGAQGGGSGARGGEVGGRAVGQQVEQLEAERVALDVEALLEVGDAGDALLRVGDHLAEQVGEGGARQLCGARAVELPVVDGLAVGGGAQAGGEGARGEGGRGGRGRGGGGGLLRLGA